MIYFTRETRAAHKRHLCSTCDRIIDPGERYARECGFDGEVWTFKQCTHCAAVVEIYDPRDWDDLISYDGFEDWMDSGPRDWAEAKAMAGWRMRWRRRYSRDLLPVPGAVS